VKKTVPRNSGLTELKTLIFMIGDLKDV